MNDKIDKLKTLDRSRERLLSNLNQTKAHAADLLLKTKDFEGAQAIVDACDRWIESIEDVYDEVIESD